MSESCVYTSTPHSWRERTWLLLLPMLLPGMRTCVGMLVQGSSSAQDDTTSETTTHLNEVSLLAIGVGKSS